MMSNDFKCWIKINANKQVIEELNNRLEKISDHKKPTEFVMAFYGDLKINDSWLYDNLGSNSVFLDEKIDDNQFSVQSSKTPPFQFFKYLYRRMSEIDPNTEIEVHYYNDDSNLIGATVIKKDDSGFSVVYNIEDKIYDMDYDEMDYEQNSRQFFIDLHDELDELVRMCHNMIYEYEGTLLEDE